jgi:hypothetical protein
MGPDPSSVPAATQTSVVVDATTTTYTFSAGPATVTLEFMTPSIDLDDDSAAYNSWPASYLTYTADSDDVRVYFDTPAQPVVADDSAAVTADRSLSTAAITVLRSGAAEQNLVSGTDDRISWGYQHVSFPAGADLETALASADGARGAFAAGESLPADDDESLFPRPCNEDWPVLAGSFALSPGEPAFLAITLDQGVSMDYYGTQLKPYWTTNYGDAGALIEAVHGGYEEVVAKTKAFDAKLRDRLSAVGGSKYADLLSLVYRQVTGALEKTVSLFGEAVEPWVFMKEISSDGDVSTVDVIYPAVPMFYWLYPETFRRTMVPIFNYANNATQGGDDYDYGRQFAPHHLGVWPVCEMLERQQEDMPVEESGNMLILLAAVAQRQGGTKSEVAWLEPFFGFLKQWADYNVASLPDPGDQLCTDDFEGPSPHNINLAAKGIVSLGAYAKLLAMRGGEQDLEDAKTYVRERASDAMGRKSGPTGCW